jgi:hypothetical protein
MSTKHELQGSIRFIQVTSIDFSATIEFNNDELIY